MKNKKLNLKKITITRLDNLNNVKGGSQLTAICGTLTDFTIRDDGCDHTRTKVTGDFPDLTTTLP